MTRTCPRGCGRPTHHASRTHRLPTHPLFRTARAQNRRQNATKTPKRAKTRHGKVRLSKYGKIRSRNGQVFHLSGHSAARRSAILDLQSSILAFSQFPARAQNRRKKVPNRAKKCQKVPSGQPGRWCGAPPTPSPSIRLKTLTMKKTPLHGQETVKFLAVAAEVTRLKLRPERRSCHSSRITHHASSVPAR